MKNKAVNTAVISALMLSLAGFSGSSFAVTVAGTLNLIAGDSSNVDVYEVNCTSGTGFRAKVQKNSGTASVQVSIGHKGVSANGGFAIDTTIAGADSGYGTADIAGGIGRWLITVGHSAAVANGYTVTYDCKTAAPATTTQIVNF